MKIIFAAAGILVVLAYIASTAFVAVDVTEIAVITQFGKPIEVHEKAGLVYKLPDPIQTTRRLDRRLQALDSNLGEYLTLDKKNFVVSTFILWQIKDARKFIQTVKDMRSAEQRLSDLVGSEIGVAIGRHPLSSLLTTDENGSKIPDIFSSIMHICKDRVYSEFGIELKDVRLRRLGFPAQNLRSVFARMRTERERIAKKYRAEGEEEAAKIRAQTDKEVRELLANAYREAQVTRGRGEAEATRIYAEAFSKDPRFYKMSRTLEAYRKLLDNKTTLILSTDSHLFKYLKSPLER